jgi:hypothetical protein
MQSSCNPGLCVTSEWSKALKAPVMSKVHRKGPFRCAGSALRVPCPGADKPCNEPVIFLAFPRGWYGVSERSLR